MGGFKKVNKMEKAAKRVGCHKKGRKINFNFFSRIEGK